MAIDEKNIAGIEDGNRRKCSKHYQETEAL